ncbi:MAG: hypothetical protein JWM00_605 [Candidatus Saccharibacteria bacterium]|nr:hypothetical protein [Candidatus Saccharibacteria bacterium]
MKWYMRGIMALLMGIGMVASGGADRASAIDCSGAIINPGPGSTNTIECVNASTVHVTCTNNINVVTSSTQTAGSGGGISSGNTNAGNVITGNATNENGQVVQIGAACVTQPASQTTSPNMPTTSSVAATPGPSTVMPTSRVVAALPNTASNSLTDVILLGVISLAGMLGISRVGVELYHRLALKW